MKGKEDRKGRGNGGTEGRERAETEPWERWERQEAVDSELSEHVGFLEMMSVPFGCHRFSWVDEKQKERE